MHVLHAKSESVFVFFFLHPNVRFFFFFIIVENTNGESFTFTWWDFVQGRGYWGVQDSRRGYGAELHTCTVSLFLVLLPSSALCVHACLVFFLVSRDLVDVLQVSAVHLFFNEVVNVVFPAMYACTRFTHTVKPLGNDHPLVQTNVVFVDRWSLFALHSLYKLDCLWTKKQSLEAGGRFSQVLLYITSRHTFCFCVKNSFAEKCDIRVCHCFPVACVWVFFFLFFLVLIGWQSLLLACFFFFLSFFFLVGERSQCDSAVVVGW